MKVYKRGEVINNYKVLGDTSILKNYDSDINIVIAIGKACVRKKMFDKINNIKEFQYPNLIDPDAIFDENIKIGIGNTIAAGTIATTNIEIGNFNVINTSCTIGHDTYIKNFVTIYPGANISGSVNVQECVEIGSGSQIIQGKDIGKNVIIGMGAVVINDIQDNITVVGVPAKNIEYRKKES